MALNDTLVVYSQVVFLYRVFLVKPKHLAEGVKSMVQVVDEIKPIPENVEVYNRVFPIYKDVYYGLNDRKVFERLSEIN